MAITSLYFMASASEAFAGNCDSRGGLAYLGNVKDGTRSVWLSGTTAGVFGLESAQGGQTVDNWTKDTRGLHLSLSPFVSNGNGGTHKLYDLSGKKPCLLDTQNQKRALIPPDFTFPEGRPDNHLPRVFPDFALPEGRPDNDLPHVIDLPEGRPDNDLPHVINLPEGRPDNDLPIIPPGWRDGTPDTDDTSQPDRSAIKGARVRPVRTTRDCVDPRSVDENQKREQPICRELVPEEAASQLSQVPLTPGRDLPAPSPWNFWWDTQFTDISDDRHGRDSDTLARSLTLGLDRRITDNFVLGMSLALEDSSTGSFNETLNIDTEGFSVGPYAAYRLTKHWAVDASLTYGRYSNDVNLSVLDGNYDSEKFSGSVTLQGQYQYGEYFFRPRTTVNFSHVESDSYDLSGRLLNLPVSLSLAGDSFNYGVLDLATEVSRYVRLPGGKPIVVFGELGAHYEFERPGGGKILTADLSEVTTSPWTFSARSGFRTLLKDNLQVEATVGYLSLGQTNLDVWEGKLRVSWAF
ncbi:autotransporter outer membrane beta-barrel domain-containing protein [Rhizobium sp. LjRoot254]|uniref:autotransporter outer membrane beta-barrel domain-containing protein n=1 Tax=Rhizobium sp. LjRoot254 TaxID=3342297 RepID=UPI003ECDD66F